MPPSLQRNGNGNSNSNANGPSTPPTGGADGVVMGCELPPELLGGARVKRKSTHTQQFSQTWCSNSPGAASGASPRSDAPVNASVQSARHKKRSREDSDSVGGAGAGGASAAASSAQAHSSTTTNGSHETQRKRPRHTDPYCEDEYRYCVHTTATMLAPSCVTHHRVDVASFHFRAQVQARVNQWLEATRNPLEAAYAKALRTSNPSAAEQTLASIRTPGMFALCCAVAVFILDDYSCCFSSCVMLCRSCTHLDTACGGSDKGLVSGERHRQQKLQIYTNNQSIILWNPDEC